MMSRRRIAQPEATHINSPGSGPPMSLGFVCSVPEPVSVRGNRGEAEWGETVKSMCPITSTCLYMKISAKAGHQRPSSHGQIRKKKHGEDPKADSEVFIKQTNQNTRWQSVQTKEIQTRTNKLKGQLGQEQVARPKKGTSKVSDIYTLGVDQGTGGRWVRGQGSWGGWKSQEWLEKGITKKLKIDKGNITM